MKKLSLLSLSFTMLFSLSTYAQEDVNGVTKDPKARAKFQKIIEGTWIGECVESQAGGDAVRADLVFFKPEADKPEQKSQFIINRFSTRTCEIGSIKAGGAEVVDLVAAFDDHVIVSPDETGYTGPVTLSKTNADNTTISSKYDAILFMAENAEHSDELQLHLITEGRPGFWLDMGSTFERKKKR
jgi:hypothetical protein